MLQITMEPTGDLTVVNGAKCRVWIGTTHDHVPVRVFVQMVRCRNDADSAQLDRWLLPMEAPPEQGGATVIPLRNIL